jgi:hypothetical protein
MAGVEELLSERGIDAGLFSLGLAVRGVRSADVRTLIKVDPNPVERLDELSLGVGVIARPVGVFNAKE